MLLAVFDEINFTAFSSPRKCGIGKLIKMTWMLINNMSKKQPIFKKNIDKKCNKYQNWNKSN